MILGVPISALMDSGAQPDLGYPRPSRTALFGLDNLVFPLQPQWSLAAGMMARGSGLLVGAPPGIHALRRPP